MRYLLIATLCCGLLTTGCQQTAPPVPTLNGTYTGTFQRQNGGTGPISQVSLVFSASGWSGSSQTPKYPALCNGTYSLSRSNKIAFANACPWTAEFDWSLILQGEYDLNVAGDAAEMTRSAAGYRDVYRLKK